MNTYQNPNATPVRSVRPGPRGTAHAKVITREAAQMLSATTRDALFAYAMTGSAVATFAIFAGSYLELLLRRIFY